MLMPSRHSQNVSLESLRTDLSGFSEVFTTWIKITNLFLILAN